MPKLTPEQKALNNAARKLRDKAYRQRKAAFYAERDAAIQRINGGPLAQAARDADMAVDAVLADKRAELADIEAQIQALQQKLVEAKLERDAVIAPLEATRRAAWNTLRQAELETIEGVKQNYLDVADCWSAGAWKPLDTFLPNPSGSPA